MKYPLTPDAWLDPWYRYNEAKIKKWFNKENLTPYEAVVGVGYITATGVMPASVITAGKLHAVGKAYEYSRQAAHNHRVAKKIGQRVWWVRAGRGARLAGKFGLKFIPGVGAGLLAYDVYSLGNWINQEVRK